MKISKAVSPEQNTPTSNMNFAVLESTPNSDGFMMPAEFEPHDGCIMIWPERPGSWVFEAKKARIAFCNVIAAIAQSETVYVGVSEDGYNSAIEMLFNGHVKSGYANKSWHFDTGTAGEELCRDMWRQNVEVFSAQTDDAWSRDIAPTFVINRNETKGMRARAVNWTFNAWGGNVDGAYMHWEKDDAFARHFCELYGYKMYDATPFVLEGGSIHSDGEGTLLVTENCLLSAGRNPQLSKTEIEEKLKTYLGAQKVLWLPCGIYLDETNEHVDNICAFINPAEVVLAWTDNKEDPQYPYSLACYTYLENQTDARGRKLTIHKLNIPDTPLCINEDDLAGYVFEEGEDIRHKGDRLAASYVNFYFSNNAIILPKFGGENDQCDKRAINLMQQWCPQRTIIPIDARDILTGGGNIHCITQQIPA